MYLGSVNLITLYIHTDYRSYIAAYAMWYVPVMSISNELIDCKQISSTVCIYISTGNSKSGNGRDIPV